MRGCPCIASVNKLLAERNGQLVGAIRLKGSGPPRAIIAVEKLDTLKREKPGLLQATFCPFCGKAYP